MRISVSLSLPEALPSDLRDPIVVAIDVLRASTTIVTAVHNGCAEITPVGTIEDARGIAASRPDVLLCGERQGRRIDGFDLGNSPFEYTRSRVSGRSLVLATTNGTVLLSRYRQYERVIGCFANLQSIESYMSELPRDRDVHIACAGKLGRPGLEDIACAGAIVSRMLLQCGTPRCDDGALAALAVYRSFDEDPTSAISKSEHAAYLCSLGMGRDVRLCSEIGSGPVPRMPAGAVVISCTEGGVG